mmetsp:Transcript_21647/g.47279  ORF Transcript_21647/g.47279 Transcript_21647/m.47279 type:complete len:359 (+) Transcript_21647:406-1482(+)
MRETGRLCSFVIRSFSTVLLFSIRLGLDRDGIRLLLLLHLRLLLCHLVVLHLLLLLLRHLLVLLLCHLNNLLLLHRLLLLLLKKLDESFVYGRRRSGSTGLSGPEGLDENLYPGCRTRVLANVSTSADREAQGRSGGGRRIVAATATAEIRGTGRGRRGDGVCGRIGGQRRGRVGECIGRNRGIARQGTVFRMVLFVVVASLLLLLMFVVWFLLRGGRSSGRFRSFWNGWLWLLWSSTNALLLLLLLLLGFQQTPKVRQIDTGGVVAGRGRSGCSRGSGCRNGVHVDANAAIHGDAVANVQGTAHVDVDTHSPKAPGQELLDTSKLLRVAQDGGGVRVGNATARWLLLLLLLPHARVH